MKNYILLLAAAVLAAACAKEAPGEARGEKAAVAGMQTLTFTADAVSTRTTLGADWSVSWNEGDAVKIVWNGGAATTSAVLDGSKVSFSASVDEVSDYYAVYPASLPASVGADGKLSLTVPSAQTGRFEDCAAIVAHTTRESLDFGQFRSAVSMIRFSLDDATLTRVSLSDPAGAKIAGKVTTDTDCASFDAEPGSGIIEAGLSGEGPYYLALVPGVNLSGLSFQLGTADAWKGVSGSDKPVSLSAGDVLCISSSVDGSIEILGDYYITVEGAGSKDGSSKADAGDAALLRSLLSSADSGSLLDGRTIHVAAGTYDLAIGDKGLSLAFDSQAVFTIEGEDGTVFTTSLSGDDGCILTVSSEGVNLSLEGITFTGGSHNGTGGALCLTKGSHTMKDCVFKDNQTTSTTAERCGGAVYVGGSASAAFESCAFTGNRAAITGGGALAVYSTARVTVLDCVFTGNLSHNGSAYVGNGGAILQKKAGNILYVVNSRFSGNGTNTNGPDVFSSAGDAIFLYNNTFSHPLNPDSKSANRGSVRVNAPAMVANCTFVVEVDETVAEAGTSNGLMAFSQNNNNQFVGNLMLSNSGYSMGVGAKYTSATTKQATTKGYNVYSEAPKLVITDEVHTDLTGVRTADVVSSTEIAADCLLHWDGPAVKLPAYNAASAEYMASVLKAYPVGGQDFYDWLVAGGIFGKDAAGTSRGDSWWPGAYQAQ